MKPPFIIAELSANHNQNLELALKTIEAAAKAGANAIKVQTYKPECLTLPCKNEHFRIQNGLWANKYLWDLYKEAQMPWEWHEDIFYLAKKLNLVCFSTPFSVEGVEFLENIECPIYKIASFEVMHIPLLRAIAQTKKPVILSLGIANDDEIEYALEILKNNESITLLYCISAYPTPIKDAKLTNIAIIKERWKKYNVHVGLSDHTLGISVPIMATLCGASMIEKHFILDKKLGGVDSEFSLDASEFSSMVENINNICILAQDFINNEKEILLTTQYQKEPCITTKEENHTRKGREFARSLFISKNVQAGEKITLDNIACVRPSKGISPLKLDDVLGKTFQENYEAGTPLLEAYMQS